jgi:hypothetical protein
MLKVILCIILSLPILVNSLRNARLDIDPDLNIVQFFLYYGIAQMFMFIVTLGLALFSTFFWFLTFFTGAKAIGDILL